MVPGKQAKEHQQRQQKIRPKPSRIEQVTQPHIGTVAGGTPAQKQHASFVRKHQRKRKDEARQRRAREGPVAFSIHGLRTVIGMTARLHPVGCFGID